MRTAVVSSFSATTNSSVVWPIKRINCIPLLLVRVIRTSKLWSRKRHRIGRLSLVKVFRWTMNRLYLNSGMITSARVTRAKQRCFYRPFNALVAMNDCRVENMRRIYASVTWVIDDYCKRPVILMICLCIVNVFSVIFLQLSVFTWWFGIVNG